jgi:hypothetical protein
LQVCLKHAPTRKLLRRILHRTGILRPSFAFNAANVADTHLTAYNEGLRAVGLSIIAEINEVDRAAFAGLLVEMEEDKNG